MPATLYNLVNRKHPADEVTTSHEETHSISANDETPPAEAEIPAQAAAIEEATATETLDEAAPEAEAVAEPSYPEWDPSWSKTQLLSVAQSLNLNVTSINTKTEIINALTAATKA